MENVWKQVPNVRRGGLTRMSRRAFLKAGTIAGGLALLSPYLTIHGAPASLAAAPARRARVKLLSGSFPEWSCKAALADGNFGLNPDQSELQSIVNTLKAQNVSVVETDTELSNWLTDAEFAGAMADATRFNALVHAAGMNVVWYYPCLEVISVDAVLTGSSMYNTHPDWVQVGLDGLPNMFTGSIVFWVEPNDEDMWMSPNGPYRDYYLNRIKLLAATGTDGIWPDVPLYFDAVELWCDTSSWARDAFAIDRPGVPFPTAENWANADWNRWIEWRHFNINRYLLDIAAAARSVNPDCFTYVETVTMDYYNATLTGLDGAYLRLADGITHSWEVDVCSLTTGMRAAQENDWACMIAMYKYARAASGAKPAWAFSYGKQADDASLVMAEVLACGCNPYECKTPLKNETANAAMRTRMYAWVAANWDRLFSATSLAEVAVYHSGPCRDIVGQPAGFGMYCTTKPSDNNWWANEASERCYNQKWLGEYRGTIRMLINAHIPFNVLTSPTFRAEDLAGYKVLLLPEFEAVSGAEAAIMRGFVSSGGTVVITGPTAATGVVPDPTGLTEFGEARADYALADVLGFHKGTGAPATNVYVFGLGKCYWFTGLPGKVYLQSATQADFDKIIGAVIQNIPPFVTTNADRRVHMEATALGDDTILQFVNSIGVTGTFTSAPTSFSVSMLIPDGKQVDAVHVTSPDNPTPALGPLAFTVESGQVTFTLALTQYAMVVITMPWSPAAPAAVPGLHSCTVSGLVRLDWTAVTVDIHGRALTDVTYHIYRAVDAPYFTPGGLPYAEVAAGTTYTDTDPSVIGNTAHATYYLVTAESGGLESAPAAVRAGAWAFPLVPGS